MRLNATRWWPIVLVIIGVGCTAACGAPTSGPKITKETLPPWSAPELTAPAPTSSAPAAQAADLGPAPAELRRVDWAQSRLPGEFCAVPGVVQFSSGAAKATSDTWGPVEMRVDPSSTVYGDLDGDGVEEAAVSVSCNNGGGTASGQLAFGYAVVRKDGDALSAVGSITARQDPPDAGHVTLLGPAAITHNEIRVQELWYRPSDATCCPSGKAETTWSYTNGTLTPGQPVITS
jgi:hypothetical protein